MYVPSQEPYLHENHKGNPTSEDEVGRDDAHLFDIELERDKSTRESKTRRNREWKGLVRDAAEPPPLRSSEVESFHAEEKNHHKLGRVKRSYSPRPPIRKKRNRQDDRRESKVRLYNVFCLCTIILMTCLDIKCEGFTWFTCRDLFTLSHDI